MTLVRRTLVVRGRRTVTAALRVVGSMTSPKKTHGVMALKYKSAHSLGDVLTQQLDDMEQEAENKRAFNRYSQTTLPKSVRC
jgi:hypothetical protein